ncbi:MAG: RNA polymerase sigma factor [Archangium sp.]|nr:RNA polymerase sigma factor [Archangium sp.]
MPPGQVIPLHGHADERVDPADFTAVVRAYRGYVAAVVMRMVGRDDEVDDLVQDVFVRALDGLSRLKDPTRLKSYLASTAVHLTVRRLGRRRLLERFGLSERWHPTLMSTPAATGEQRAMLSNVYRVLETRPAQEQVAWSLRYLEGESLERVAELMGLSLATVKRRLAAADAVLQEVHRE